MRQQQAFSLLEMLTVLVIMSVVMAISMPSLRDFYLQTTDHTLQASLLTTLKFAESTARARHMPIGLCGSSNRQLCDDGWLQNIVVFADENEDGVITNKEQIIHVLQMKASTGKLHCRAFPFYRQYLQFTANTHLQHNDNGTLWYCRTAEVFPRWAIVLNQLGRTKLLTPDGQGHIVDASGKFLRC